MAGVVHATLRAALAIVMSISSVGCARHVLDSPVVIGASVSDGAKSAFAPTSRVADGSLTPRVIDLASALDAWLVSPHAAVASHADSTAFLDPVASLREQVALAKREQRTLVFAVDALFWSLYAEAASDSERTERFDAALDQLARLEVPALVGDVPDMHAAVSPLMAHAEPPSEELRRHANDELRAWARRHPHVTVFPLADLVERAADGGAIVIRERSLAGDDAKSLLSSDGLHASARGTMALAAAALEALIAANVVDPSAVRPTWSDAESALNAQRAAITPDSKGIDVARRAAVTADLDRYMRFLSLERAHDRAAIDCGLAIIAACPTARGPTCEASVARALIARWPEAKSKLEAVEVAAASRAVGNQAAIEDLVVWSLIAVGLDDVDAMRSSARAWNAAAARSDDAAYDVDAAFHAAATRVYRELLHADERSAGELWPDPVRAVAAWQFAWARDARATQAADRVAARGDAPDARGPSMRPVERESPRVRASELESALRVAGRAADADRVRAMLPSLTADPAGAP